MFLCSFRAQISTDKLLESVTKQRHGFCPWQRPGFSVWAKISLLYIMFLKFVPPWLLERTWARFTKQYMGFSAKRHIWTEVTPAFIRCRADCFLILSKFLPLGRMNSWYYWHNLCYILSFHRTFVCCLWKKEYLSSLGHLLIKCQSLFSRRWGWGVIALSWGISLFRKSEGDPLENLFFSNSHSLLSSKRSAFKSLPQIKQRWVWMNVATQGKCSRTNLLYARGKATSMLLYLFIFCLLIKGFTNMV